MVAKMASDAEKRINLTALQRRDPYITDILDSATQVALYTFNHTTNEWEKTEIEGTLFVYTRVAPPHSGFTIMNRLSMDNLTEPLGSDIDFQNQSPFLLYRNAKMNIYGIWFYDLYDCTRIGKLLAEKCEEIKKGSSASGPRINGNAKHIVLPSPSSVGGSTTSSLSENAIEEETMSNTEHNIEELSNSSKTSSRQANNVLDILFKAKDEYNKTHSNDSASNEASSTPTTIAQLFKPIQAEQSKKLDVSTLFDLNNVQKTQKTERPSSAEIFDKILADNSNQELPRPRRATRSMSLCLSGSATPPSADIPLKGIVNGAISVEELESPVLGNSSSRNRYHSVSESVMRNVPSPKVPVETDSAFHKLLSKMAVTTNTGNQQTISSIPSEQNNITAKLLSGFKPPDRHSPKRQLSLPMVPGTTNYVRNELLNMKMYSTSPSSSFSASSTLPVVKEQSVGDTKLFSKSMSVASGLCNMQINNTPSPLRVSALHGTTAKPEVELLSPEILQSNISEEHAMATSLGLHTSSKNLLATTLDDANPHNVSQTTTPLNQEASSSVEVKPTLISPDDFEHSTSNELRQRLMPKVEQETSVEPMDQKQLADALIHLLQTNQSFVNTIHNAYLTGFKKQTAPNGPKTLPPTIWK
uniref:5'-(N(7)-methylguanosine 5'-triphospho)-[mRNA] hydrolase n=1 Tax=Phallusia mammillata TaxID=59560 RepID=A0A6F9DA09_9ASCI|nr:mRNA-decapping enzyme 1B-like [Phallusia mammillata]